MIKVVQPSGKPISGIVTSMGGQPVKIFKSPNNQESLQVFIKLILFITKIRTICLHNKLFDFKFLI